VYEHPEALDMEAMSAAAALLCGTHDFKAFTSAKKGKKSTVRSVRSISVEQAGDEITFTYTGDGFLYHMVRILTGTLIEVGEGKRSFQDVEAVLKSGKRENAGVLVPAKGLTLVKVYYE
ncbi:MAG: tRNA pseudouridine(38-40) synthase TruA, partial [Lachnospiraceae bacterium]|nr:tRNA pseudouridine(38-40) synthase TruA [Lachnospiraceae bacterium]